QQSLLIHVTPRPRSFIPEIPNPKAPPTLPQAHERVKRGPPARLRYSYARTRPGVAQPPRQDARQTIDALTSHVSHITWQKPRHLRFLLWTVVRRGPLPLEEQGVMSC